MKQTTLHFIKFNKLWVFYLFVTTLACTRYGEETQCAFVAKIEELGNYRVITLESGYFLHDFDNYPYDRDTQVCFISPSPKRSIRFIPENNILSVTNK